MATFIQAKRIGPVGSGMLNVQGTSFAFLGAILTAGFIVKGQGGGPDEILATIFGICFVGAFIEIVLSRFLHVLKGIITPVVTGTVVMLIGLSLVKVGITDMAGGQWLLDNKPQLDNEFCPIAAFQVEDHILTFQGHPELEKKYTKALMELRKQILGHEIFR